MAHQFIKDLRDGDAVKQFFILRRIEYRKTRNGEPYWDLLLGDRTGTLKGKVWADVLQKYPGPVNQADFVGVTGQVVSFNEELQLTVKFIMTVDQIQQKQGTVKDLDPALLIPCTPYDPDMMWQELVSLAENHLQPPLRELVLRLLQTHADNFKVCPAARLYHHPYQGGLLEHTWFVARLVLQATSVYTHLNRSLALAGAILHDVGKILEITKPQAPEYSTAGQLVGHIILGCEMLRAEAAAMDFPDPALLLQLEHIIVSHHGYQEFGSPIPPKSREALLVYYMDDLDAKMKMMDQHLETDTNDKEFTSYHRLLQREIYKADAPPRDGVTSVEPQDD